LSIDVIGYFSLLVVGANHVGVHFVCYFSSA